MEDREYIIRRCNKLMDEVVSDLAMLWMAAESARD